MNDAPCLCLCCFWLTPSLLSSSQDADDDETSNRHIFDRGSSSTLVTPLSTVERRFAVDIMFGIIATILSQRCPVHNLYPLISFIAFNLDMEWEAKSAGDEDQVRRNNRHLASLEAVSVLFFLLHKYPVVPDLIESLTAILESGSGVASWMLCCMVNSFDDAIRGLGIKCLVAYLHATVSASAVSPGDTTALSTHDNDGASSSTKISKTMFGVISQSSNVLTSLLSGRDNVKVIYKLLWHLLKCHRERLGDDCYSALMYLLVDHGKSTVPNNATLGGFRLDIDGLDAQRSRLNVATTLSRQTIRNAYGVSTVLRLLRFLSNEQTERWLFDFLALILASPTSVTVVLSCDDWQPCLFQLVAKVRLMFARHILVKFSSILISFRPSINRWLKK